MGGTVWGQDLRLSFDRQNNFTYSTKSSLAYYKEKEKYRIQAYFTHDIIINTNRQPASLVLFNVRAQLWQFWRWKKGIEWTSFTEVDQFWTTKNQRYSQYVGGTYHLKDILEGSLLLGYSWDFRSARLDQGFSPALRLRSSYQFEDGTRMESRLWSRLKFIEPRHQRNISLLSHWSKELSAQSQVAVGIEMGSNQMDDYKLSSIEQIESDTVAAFLSLRYKVRPKLEWSSDNRLVVNRRIFDYVPFENEMQDFNDLRFNQTLFSTLQQLDYTHEKWTLQGRYGFEYLERFYQLENDLELSDREFDRLLERERQKDAFRRTTSLSVNANYQLGKKNILRLEGYNNYIQFDTPSEDNFDDHDELTYGVKGSWDRRWSSTFQSSHQLTASLRQYAFLFKERSSDNYTQRNLRLNFSYTWLPFRKLKLVGQQRIYVTYNVKDFDDPNLTDRSTRNLETQINMTWRPAKKWNMRATFYRKEIHVSYLNWERFTETTLDTTITLRAEWINTYRTRIGKSPFRINWEIGAKHAERLRYLNSSMTSIENILTPINLHINVRQTGPLTGFQLFGKKGTLAELRVWWQWQIQDFDFKEISDFQTLSSFFREEQLREVDISFRPFISLRVNIWLD